MNHVQTQENRIKKFFLAVLLFFALGCILAGVFVLGKPNVANADTQNLKSETNASLFLPASYENYLELSAPSSVAIGERYVAVADGKKIYIYDHLDPSEGYRVWEHNKGAEKVTVGKMQFTDDRLFFSSASGLYELTLNGSLAEKKMSDDFTPYTFLIAENILYVVTVNDGSDTVLYRFEMKGESFALANAHSITVSTSSSQQSTPLLAYTGNTVYCSLNGTVYKYKYNGEALSGDGNFSLDNTASSTLTPSSVCAIGDSLYFTDNAGLYRADTRGNAELIEPAKNISALYPRGDLLFCLYGKAVRAYDTAANTFIDYEISSSSNSVNRLNGAKDIVRAGSLLVTADTNNNRISVYDMQKHSFDTISVDYSPTLVATDGERIAAAADNTVYAYACDIHGNWDETTKHSLEPSDNVSGVACLFGKVYYTSATRRGVLGGPSVLNMATSKGLAANLYGDLFVASEGGTVKRFTEETFVQNGDGKETNITLPGNFTCLRAGFDGKLYYLDDSKNLCMVDIDDAEKTVKTVASVDGKDFVYTGDVSKKPVSFALGFEDDEVYFCFGDFIVKSNAGALGLSTLETLSETVLKTAEDKISFVQNAEDIRLADCASGAVGIHGNLNALLGEDSYSWKGEDDKNYKRYAISRRGVVLDAQEKYSLVALYADHVYSVEIFRNEDLTEAFAPETEDAAGHEMYLASGCPSYHFPCIAEAPAQGDVLARGARVQVLTVVHEGGQEAECGGYDFAYIQFETGARASMRAYVPYAYLTEVNPLGDTLETFTQGYVKPGVTFAGSDGSELTTEERVSANLYKNDDGTYTAVFTSDGVTYTANVEEGNIEWGESDAIRIALIITLSVVAALIIGAYFYLLPREKKIK